MNQLLHSRFMRHVRAVFGVLAVGIGLGLSWIGYDHVAALYPNKAPLLWLPLVLFGMLVSLRGAKK